MSSKVTRSFLSLSLAEDAVLSGSDLNVLCRYGGTNQGCRIASHCCFVTGWSPSLLDTTEKRVMYSSCLWCGGRVPVLYLPSICPWSHNKCPLPLGSFQIYYSRPGTPFSALNSPNTCSCVFLSYSRLHSWYMALVCSPLLSLLGSPL